MRSKLILAAAATLLLAAAAKSGDPLLPPGYPLPRVYEERTPRTNVVVVVLQLPQFAQAPQATYALPPVQSYYAPQIAQTYQPRYVPQATYAPSYAAYPTPAVVGSYPFIQATTPVTVAPDVAERKRQWQLSIGMERTRTLAPTAGLLGVTEYCPGGFCPTIRR